MSAYDRHSERRKIMSETLSTKKSEHYGSKFGAIMSMAGMAIGLGNVYRFPYMVGAYGGGAFVIAYLICALLIVTPIAVMEAGYGKQIGKGLVEAYEAALHKKGVSKVIGCLCGCIYGTMNFFFIPVMATCIYFMYVSLTGGFKKAADVSTMYADSLGNYGYMILMTIVLALVIGFVIFKGVQQGIEAISKVMVPLMFLFFIIVIIFAVFAIDGIGKGFDYYLNPDFSWWAKPSMWVGAMGQALFSIGVGPGCVLIYGSHLPKKNDVTVSLTTVCLLDTSIAMIAGMSMIPACIAMGLDPEAGTGLIFVILPALFAQLPLGGLIGFMVFAAIFFAAITSAVAQQEVPVYTFMNCFGISRAKASLVSTIITAAAAGYAAYSLPFMDFWNMFAGNYGFIITAGIGSVVYGWVYGVEKIRVQTLNTTSGVRLGKWYTYWCKYICIPIMILVMLNSLFPFVG